MAATRFPRQHWRASRSDSHAGEQNRRTEQFRTTIVATETESRPDPKFWRLLRRGARMKTASEEVTDMIFLSKWSSQTLCAWAELGVFDCLSRDGTRTANDVAAETGLDP